MKICQLLLLLLIIFISCFQFLSTFIFMATNSGLQSTKVWKKCRLEIIAFFFFLLPLFLFFTPSLYLFCSLPSLFSLSIMIYSSFSLLSLPHILFSLSSLLFLFSIFVVPIFFFFKFPLFLSTFHLYTVFFCFVSQFSQSIKLLNNQSFSVHLSSHPTP